VAPGSVDSTLTPGAPRWTEVAPKFEKLAIASWLSIAATAMTFGIW
jgi:hypothetical protein